VSEPSNPWVSGVSGLFSIEFYSQVRHHLHDGGLLVQWVHVYEMTPALVATIVTALAANFDDYELWMANHGDMLVVAAHKGKVPPIDARAFDNPHMRSQLERFNIRNQDDLLQHRVAGRAALGPYYAAFGVRPNSDFAPILDLNATFARFLRQQVDDVPALMEAGLPILAMFDGRQVRLRSDPSRLSIPDGQQPYLRRTELARQARQASTYLRGAAPVELERLPAALTAQIVLLRGALVRCTLEPVPEAIDRALGEVAQLINSHLSQAERQAVWKLVTGSPCRARLKTETRRWLALHTAVAAENGKLIAHAAEALLAEPGDMIPELIPYTVAAHMSGLLLEGEPQAALQSFQKHRASLQGGPAWEPVFRFLVGQTVAM
jgi:spermidine synthase